MASASPRPREGLRVAKAVYGGATRQGSVHAGLEALSGDRPDIVLVHDAARPFTSAALVDRAIAAAEKTGAAIPALPVTDTVKLVDNDSLITATLDRSHLRTVQTPQAFAYSVLLDAHRRAATAGRSDFSDDAALAEWAGLKVAVFEGEARNAKMTTPEDFVRAERDAQAALADIRTGIGYDIHAFDSGGDHVWLGGVKIPHARKLAGHSDADVALHALTDAILGALADGDIGVHFPPSDEKWRGASSDRFLAFAVERVKARGGVVSHLDVAIVCEAPKINPRRDEMRARIAEIAGLSIDRVGVKATTNEKLGAIGRARRDRRLCHGDHPPPLDRAMIDDEIRALATRVLDACRVRQWMVATAESCTGGLVAGALTEIAGSSDVVDRGFVTYSNAAKMAMLGVPEATLRQHGAVSRQTALAMASGALARADVPPHRGDHRHCRPRRRHGREAGRARAFRRGDQGRRPYAPREALRRYRAQRSAPPFGDRGAHHAAGAGGLKRLRSSGFWLSIDLVGAALEGLRKAPERGLEHRAHQHARACGS